jgi:hypothetical protein
MAVVGPWWKTLHLLNEMTAAHLHLHLHLRLAC